MKVFEMVAGGPKREEVMRDTWGHLDARAEVKYPGTILFAEGEYGGERFILRSDFGDEVGYGPWFYDGIHDWLHEQDTEPGQLYRFDGWYRLHDDEHEFVGEIRPLAFRDSQDTNGATDGAES